MSSSQVVLHIAIYAAGTFYANPLKVFLNAVVGSRYAIAFGHFRRDHSVPLNIILHALCLVIQVLGNFAMLHVFDQALGTPLATVTALTWTAFLATTPSPVSVRLASAASILIAWAARQQVAASFTHLALLQAPFEIACYWLILPYHGFERPDVPRLTAMLVARVALWCALAPVRGILRPVATLGNALAILTLTLGSVVRAKDNMPLCEHLGLAAWAPALLLDAPWLFFLCISFVGQALQGVSHQLTGQEGTLPQLNDAAHELAHCAYFPNLVFQTIHHSLKGPYAPTVKALRDYPDPRSRQAMGLDDTTGGKAD